MCIYLLGDIIETETCEVDEEFSHLNYKVSPDGLFELKLVDSLNLDLEKLTSIRVTLEGNYIPFEKYKHILLG